MKCTQIRARVEKRSVLGWNKSYVSGGGAAPGDAGVTAVVGSGEFEPGEDAGEGKGDRDGGDGGGGGGVKIKAILMRGNYCSNLIHHRCILVLP